MLNHSHWRHEPILVACKTLTKSSTYVKFVITFEGAANPAHNLILCGLQGPWAMLPKVRYLGSFCMWDFWQILYAELSDLPFWSLFVHKLYPTLVATIIICQKVSNIKNRVFHPQKVEKHEIMNSYVR